MKNILALTAFLLLWTVQSASFASDLRIVATIKPLHSIATAISADIAEPKLVIKGAKSPHGYRMKPSDAELFENADVLIWIGPQFESTLNSAVKNLSKQARVIEVDQIAEISRLPIRGPAHDHGDEHHESHESGDHNEHAEDEHDHDEHEHAEDEHDHDEHEHAEDEHDHDEHEHAEHDHGNWDLHFWLDTGNARVIAKSISNVLKQLEPDHHDQIQTNLNNFLNRLDDLDEYLEAATSPVRNLPYMVFHDAYQYMEKQWGMNYVGAVLFNPERNPGAKKIVETREIIVASGAVCIFKEPQFNPNIIETIAEGTSVKIGTLDPLGADIEAGADAYFTLMRNLIGSISDCLG